MDDPCAKLLRNSIRDFKSVFCCLPLVADLKDEAQDVLKLSNIFSIFPGDGLNEASVICLVK